MKKMMAFMLIGLALLVPGQGADVKNYSATFTKSGYFGIGFSDEDFSIVLKSREDVDRYIQTITKKLEEESRAVSGEYWMQLEGEIKNFYAKYDEEFFYTSNLIFALVARGSGSMRFNVSELTCTDGTLTVYITQNSPMVMTCDYVQWVLMLEVSKSDCDIKSVRITKNF